MTTETQVVAALEVLASKVGQTVEYMWPRAVQYTWAEGLTGVIGGLLGMLVLAFAIRWLWAGLKEADSKPTYHENVGWHLGLGAAVTVFVVAFIFVVTFLPQTLAPEGYLIQSIIKGVGAK